MRKSGLTRYPVLFADSCKYFALQARAAAVTDHDRREEADAIREPGCFYRLKAE